MVKPDEQPVEYKVRCVFPVVIWSKSCMVQNRDNGHREDALHFMELERRNKRILNVYYSEHTGLSNFNTFKTFCPRVWTTSKTRNCPVAQTQIRTVRNDE